MSDSELIDPTDPYLGRVIDSEYTVARQIGLGGMGAVYLSTQRLTDRPVALKILHRHLIDKTLLKRFTQEARIISNLNHPNIVTVYRYGQHADGTLYIAMEFADGKDLSEVIMTEGTLDLRRGLPLMLEMADALAYAHENKVVHRDIKPENIIITKTGRRETVKILDFGIAKLLDNNYIVTKTGMLCGSPAYMSPEQWRQTPDIDGRADIYALGCVFYSMLTGKLPFYSDTTMGYMYAHLNETPPPAIEVTSTLGVLPVVSEIISKCIQRERDNRYADGYALHEALKEAEAEFDGVRRRSARRVTKVDDLRVPEEEVRPAAQVTPGEGSPAARPRVDEALPAPALTPTPRPAGEPREYRQDGFGLATLEWSEKTKQSRIFTEPEVVVTTEGAKKMHRLLVILGIVAIIFLTVALVYLMVNRPKEQSGDQDPGSQLQPRVIPLEHSVRRRPPLGRAGGAA